METQTLRVLARIGAIEFLIENLYAVALMQCFDPVSEARKWSDQLQALSREAASGLADADKALSAALVRDMARELDVIFGRIAERVERRAREHPTAGEA